MPFIITLVNLLNLFVLATAFLSLYGDKLSIFAPMLHPRIHRQLWLQTPKNLHYLFTINVVCGWARWKVKNLHGGGTLLYGAEVKRLPLPPIESDLSMGKTCSLVAFHLNGILALYMASTRTLSPTCGLDPFTQQLKQTFRHF